MAGQGARQNRRERRKSLQKEDRTQKKTDHPTESALKPVSYKPKSPGQAALKNALFHNRLVFASGEAGTFKTGLCVDRAADLFLSGEVERLILTRPAVEADEKLGFLPGDSREKLDPYLRPLFDALKEKLGGGPRASLEVERMIKTGVLEIAPLGFMRGRTFKHAAILADEMQNASYKLWKMLITRMGEGSWMFVNGDPTQSDIDRDGIGGDMIRLLNKFEANGYPVIRLAREDVFRDPIVSDVLRFL